MKTCNKCGEEKPLNMFYKKKRMADGHLNQCGSCMRAKKKQWRLDNPDHHRSYNKKWREENAERHKATTREWRENNRASILGRNREWKRLNPSYINSLNAKRRAMMQHGCSQMPDSERAEVEYLYWLARDLTAVSGEQYHVDHIKPLSKGGEHRLDNLQILHAEDNLKKGAKHDQSA